MDKYLFQYKTWFNARNLREKLLVFGLSWAVIYAIFALFLFRPIDAAIEQNTNEMKIADDKIKTWKIQLQYLADIPKSALYKEWLADHKDYETLKGKYKNLLGGTGDDRWDKIIKTVLNKYPNITIEKIENRPETAYVANKALPNPESIFQQQMRVSVLGNFQDIVSYLTSLEAAMPTIHWDTLTYTVIDYPIARVEMEFSILYEKPKA